MTSIRFAALGIGLLLCMCIITTVGAQSRLSKYHLPGFSTRPTPEDPRSNKWTSGNLDRIRSVVSSKVESAPCLKSAFRAHSKHVVSLKRAETRSDPAFGTRVLILHDRQNLYVYATAELSGREREASGRALTPNTANERNAISVMVDPRHDHLLTWVFSVSQSDEREAAWLKTHTSEDMLSHYATSNFRWHRHGLKGPPDEVTDKDWSAEQQVTNNGKRWLVRFTIPWKVLYQPVLGSEAAFDYNRHFSKPTMGLNVVRPHIIAVLEYQDRLTPIDVQYAYWGYNKAQTRLISWPDFHADPSLMEPMRRSSQGRVPFIYKHMHTMARLRNIWPPGVPAE